MVGLVLPMVPQSGGGHEKGHLGGQVLTHTTGGHVGGHGGGHDGEHSGGHSGAVGGEHGGGHGGGHGGHGGHLGGGGHFSRVHLSEQRCSSFLRQLGWHLASHFCSHLGSQFLGSRGLFLSSLDIFSWIWRPEKK